MGRGWDGEGRVWGGEVGGRRDRAGRRHSCMRDLFLGFAAVETPLVVSGDTTTCKLYPTCASHPSRPTCCCWHLPFQAVPQSFLAPPIPTYPPQGLLLLIVGPHLDQMMSGRWVLHYHATPSALQCLGLSCAVAALVNISQFMCLGRFHAVTFQVGQQAHVGPSQNTMVRHEMQPVFVVCHHYYLWRCCATPNASLTLHPHCC